MKRYKAKNGEILDENGMQIAVVVASNCPKSMARRMAQYAVDRLNADERGKAARQLHFVHDDQRSSSLNSGSPE